MCIENRNLLNVSSIPSSPSLSDETPHPSSETLKNQKPLQVEPPGIPGQRTTKSINPPGMYWYSQGTRPQTIIPSSPEPLSVKPLGFPILKYTHKS